ncbi:MAG: hypothetical protein KF824_03870 [Fimbriimonadaceae bacterium]|nr:MAG: hypothetical protein KF824_03870 [Fimbriimonadaceae bacterium]
MRFNKDCDWRLERIWTVQNNILITLEGRRHYLTVPQLQDYKIRHEKPDRFWIRGRDFTFDQPPDFVQHPELN